MKHKDVLTQLRASTPAQISDKINDSRAKLITLEQDKILGKLKNAREITATRKFIARAMTILDEKVTNETK